jgi:hypothetical protein
VAAAKAASSAIAFIWSTLALVAMRLIMSMKRSEALDSSVER